MRGLTGQRIVLTEELAIQRLESIQDPLQGILLSRKAKPELAPKAHLRRG